MRKRVEESFAVLESAGFALSAELVRNLEDDGDEDAEEKQDDDNYDGDDNNENDDAQPEA